MTDEELENWNKLPCILEVDLKYSKNLHTHSQRLSISPRKHKTARFAVTKLTPNLNDKKKYVVWYKTLKLY